MLSKHEKEFLEISSKLDAMSNSYGEITNCSSKIIDFFKDEDIRFLVSKISEISSDKMIDKETKTIAKFLKDSLIDYCGYKYVKSICSSTQSYIEDSRTLPELLEELNGLIGLENVKKQVNDLIAYQTVQKIRYEHGLHSMKNTLHMAFTGNPGTGKTTVARIIGHLYKLLGLLSKGHFIEVSRTDLIAGYQGQTAMKVKKVIEQAKGGVLFIDEAYSITENENSDSYGRECLTELTKALEDYREDLVVIVAGYTEPMNKFFESNPGLKSRFNTFIEFDDYSAVEMDDILISMCEKNDYILTEEAKVKIHHYFEQEIISNNKNFANGRLARNLFDGLVMCHARRVINIDNPNREDLSTIEVADFNISNENEKLVQ